MKKYHKILSLAVAFALCALLFAGCGQTDSSSSSSASDSQSASDSTSDSGSTSTSDSSGGGTADAVDFSAGLDENGHLTGVRALDYVTLPENYKAIPVPAADAEVTKEELDAQIASLLANYAEPEQITDRAIEDGDYVNIDYSGSVDGEKFDGGTAEAQRVLAGSNQFIDDFLTQIIGHKPGESFSIEVTFPDPYENNPDLAGKDAVFEVTINYIEGENITPEFTDDFVNTNLNAAYGWTNTLDVETEITGTMRESKLMDFAWQYLMDNAQLTEIPEAATQFQKDMLVNQITSQASMYGLTLQDFLSGMGVESKDALFEQSAEDIEWNAKQQVIMQAIMEDAALEATETALSDYFYEEMGTDDYSSFEEYYGKPYLALVVLSEQVNQLLLDGVDVAES